MRDCPWIDSVIDEVADVMRHLWNVISSLPHSEIIGKHSHVDLFDTSHKKYLTNEVFHIYEKMDRQ
jgi:hypothetical protein